MKLLKCISSIDAFDSELFKRLQLGVELQDFAKPNLELGEIARLVEKYKQVLQDFTLPLAMHGPYLDLKPLSPDDQIKNVTYAKYKRTIEIASELNVDTLVLHSQINPWLNLHDKTFYHQAYREFFKSVLIEAGGFDGTIVLENIFENDPQQLKLLIDGIDLPNIKVCLDIGHAQIHNHTKLNDWIQTLGNTIHYVHVHTNNRIHDLHEPITNESLKKLRDYLVRYTHKPMLALEYDTDDLSADVKRVKAIIKNEV